MKGAKANRRRFSAIIVRDRKLDSYWDIQIDKDCYCLAELWGWAFFTQDDVDSKMIDPTNFSNWLTHEDAGGKEFVDLIGICTQCNEKFEFDDDDDRFVVLLNHWMGEHAGLLWLLAGNSIADAMQEFSKA